MKMTQLVLVVSVALVCGASAARGGDAECVGACANPLLVNVTDLVRGVSIALEQAAVDTCPAFDANGDQRVTVDELLQGVRNALEGCGPTSSSGDLCAGAPPILTATDSPGIAVSTADASREAADPVLSCGCAESPRTVWASYTATADGRLRIVATSRPKGQALALFAGECAARTVLVCATLNHEEVLLDVAATAGTRYLVEVAAGCDGSGGGVILNAELCGDGITTGAEECDDGNAGGGDGCDAHCTFEGVGVIDTQSVRCGSGGSLNLHVAPIGQLFVPSVTALAGADLMLTIQVENQPQAVTLHLRRDGIGGEVLAEQTITTSALPGAAFYHFRFVAPVAVVPGQTYALEVTSAGDNVSWVRKHADREECPLVYPGGGGIGGGQPLNGEDFIFRTYAAL